jgi:hypothetical protein
MHNPNDRLDDLLARLVEESLLPEEQVELETRLASDAEARRRYVHYLDLHSELQASFAMRDLGPCAKESTEPVASPGLSSGAPSLGRLWMGAAACVALGMAFASVAWSYATPRLRGRLPAPVTVFSDGFEAGHGPIGPGLPKSPGAWSGDDAQIVGPEQSLRPKAGTSMLKFFRSTYSGENAPRSAWGDVCRIVEWPGALGSEQGRVRLSASFAATPSEDPEQYAMSVELIALDSFADIPPGPNALSTLDRSSHTHASRLLPIKRDGSWQQIFVETFVSSQTRYVLIHVAMVRRYPEASAEPVQFRGHYLDDVKLEFIPQPDPSLSTR